MKHTFGAGAPSLGDYYSLCLSDCIGMDEMEGFLLRFCRMKTEEKTTINLSGFFGENSPRLSNPLWFGVWLTNDLYEGF